MKKDYIITISYGDYLIGVGGTDKVILAQQKIFNENELSVIHICPAGTIKNIRIKGFIWKLIEDGENRKIFTTEGLLKYLDSLGKNGFNLKVILLHHLKNIYLDELHKILVSTAAPIFFYIHDYFTICPFGGLIKNDSEYCEISNPSELLCKGCEKYSLNTTTRRKAIEDLFQTLQERLTIIAPSSVAKDIWCSAYPQYEKKCKVIYHQRLIGYYKENREQIPNSQPLKIAFVGYQKNLKGWPQWEKATQKAHLANKNEIFYQFGSGDKEIDYIEKINVNFSDNLMSMTEALRKHNIHCAVLWSTVPETYSYTYYESLAANCFIITNEKSGNIAVQTKKRKNGVVIQGIEGLSSFLLDEEKIRLSVNEYRQNENYGPLSLIESDEIISYIPNEKYIFKNGFKKNMMKEIYLHIIKFLLRIKEKRNINKK